MNLIYRRLVVLTLVTLCLIQPAFTDDSAEKIREELDALKAEYSGQIANLEARLQAMEGGTDTNEPVVVLTSRTPPDNFPEYITKGFQFHGYLRSGSGVNGEGGSQVPFLAPGADAKYRLGNEVETYGELAFVQEFVADPKEPFFNVQVRLAYHTDEETNYDPDNDQFTIRESFVYAGNFDWAPDMKFWAGQRFYRRHDIHIIDFYFFNMSAYGGGVEDIDLRIDDAKLALAYLGGSTDKYEFPGRGRIDKNTVDLRVYDFNVPFGKGMLWLAPSHLEGGNYTSNSVVAGVTTTNTYDTTSGLAIGALHTRDFLNGYNKLSIQYGLGTSSDFGPDVQDPSPYLDNSWQFRVTESAVIQGGDQFSVMGAFVYQVKDNGAPTDSRLTWISTGARPIYHFTRNVAIAVEGGVDWVDSEPDDYNGALFKLTFAPELRIDNRFLGRPVLRAYATYATWGDEFEGRIGGSAYENSTDGLAFGLQGEAWW